MLSRVPLRAPARVLSGRHVRSHPIPAAQCCDLDIRPVRRQSVQICRIPRVAVSPFSSSCALYDTPNNPGKSGDKGPAKNYRKKMRKKRIKAMTNAEESQESDAILEGMRAIQSLIVGNEITKPSSESPKLDSVLEGAKRPIKADQSKAVKKEKKQVATKRDPASILEAIAMGTKVMLDQSKDMEQREGEKVEDATGPALFDALAEEEAKTSESKMTPQNRAKAVKQQQEKKRVPVEKQHAPASILEAIAEGTKMMETLLDQSKAVEQRTGGIGDDTVDAVAEGYKIIESLSGRPRTRGAVGTRKERRGVDDLEYPDYMQHFRDSDSGVQTSSSRGFSRRERNMRAMDDRGAPRQRGDGKEYDFTKPGERLGLFHHPKPGSEATPPPHSKLTLAEQDEVNKLRELFLLKPTSHFEEQMEGAMTTTVRYPRTFPIDNDDYFKNHKEAFVGFEEHVLLDHLLEGFPKRGPVRHFMELVVTGLSKNPHYTAAEKRQCVEWYKDYFTKFTSSELQSL